MSRSASSACWARCSPPAVRRASLVSSSFVVRSSPSFARGAREIDAHRHVGGWLRSPRRVVACRLVARCLRKPRAASSPRCSVLAKPARRVAPLGVVEVARRASPRCSMVAKPHVARRLAPRCLRSHASLVATPRVVEVARRSLRVSPSLGGCEVRKARCHVGGGVEAPHRPWFVVTTRHSSLHCSLNAVRWPNSCSSGRRSLSAQRLADMLPQ